MEFIGHMPIREDIKSDPFSLSGLKPGIPVKMSNIWVTNIGGPLRAICRVCKEEMPIVRQDWKNNNLEKNHKCKGEKENKALGVYNEAH